MFVSAQGTTAAVLAAFTLIIMLGGLHSKFIRTQRWLW
jgi:hypothetical protein